MEYDQEKSKLRVGQTTIKIYKSGGISFWDVVDRLLRTRDKHRDRCEIKIKSVMAISNQKMNTILMNWNIGFILVTYFIGFFTTFVVEMETIDFSEDKGPTPLDKVFNFTKKILIGTGLLSLACLIGIYCVSEIFEVNTFHNIYGSKMLWKVLRRGIQPNSYTKASRGVPQGPEVRLSLE
ncbi:hypothetical protein PRIPAC_89161 [Pristionchus pacificus]|uniref:Uncharacterized protein n=1 Tax=Pristionchus pacificus TaxID=54126 RepID=A0A2A6CWE8_PRIPA|nr:hypothetical protein PRIPAC_89161 [Pristionchus pacificus]|eukprot:PDM82420.1 hypothetical protein PRIPAC_36813 [Pristionchus pacificus]